MDERYEIYFWCAAVSPHHLPLFAAALAHPRVSRSVYIGQVSKEPLRQALGWQINLPEGGEVIVGPNAEKIDEIVRNSSSEAIHIFYGMRWVPCIVQGIAACLRHGRRFGIFHEPRVFEGIKGLARLAHSWLTERDLRRKADFVLAIGAHGPSWFQMSGYDRKRIFPAAYFLDLTAPAPGEMSGSETRTSIKVGFVGRLEKLKGFDLFMRATALVRSNVEFIIAGSGSLVPKVTSLANFDARVSYRGVVQMDEVARLMNELDILVLPSITKDDGWGAVVSEALAAGAAVVTSDRVGASMCLDGNQRGFVVAACKTDQIASAVDCIIDRNLLTRHHRQARSAWALAHLDKQCGVRYLLSIFDHLYKGAPRPPSFALD